MNGRLRPEPQLLLNFDLDPQSLTVEAVLVTLVVAGHREEALIGILVRSSPGMMHAHRIVRRDGPVEKAPTFATRVLASQLLKRLLGFPEFQYGVFAGNKIAVSDGLKHVERKPEFAFKMDDIKRTSEDSRRNIHFMTGI